MPDSKGADDLRGAGKLTTDAIEGIIAMVESSHATIGSLGTTRSGKTSGITGFIYRLVRLITKLIGIGVDQSLKELNGLLSDKETSPKRELVLAALNGVVGDYLHRKNNPLAIKMHLRVEGRPISADEVLKYTGPGTTLLVLVHGLCMNDLQWTRKGHNHGNKLEESLNLLPIFLHYNTGKHVSENGLEFSEIMESFMSSFSGKVNFIAHSMGGLVLRSALHQGALNGRKWVESVEKVVFLGTPHNGALLEKAGNWVDIALDSNSYSRAFSRIGKIRSSGITDMRKAFLVDDDWKGFDRFQFSSRPATHIPLPTNIKCYTLAGIVSEKENAINHDLVGDGLVSLNSALGIKKSQSHSLAFPKEHTRVVYGLNHMNLLSDERVYSQLEEWLK